VLTGTKNDKTASGGETVETMEWSEKEDEEESGYVTGPLLSVGEAARYLGVTRKAVYALLESGRLIAVKGGKSVKLVPKENLDEFRSSGELT
jgi:excisionase family DNA binding protein